VILKNTHTLVTIFPIHSSSGCQKRSVDLYDLPGSGTHYPNFINFKLYLYRLGVGTSVYAEYMQPYVLTISDSRGKGLYDHLHKFYSHTINLESHISSKPLPELFTILRRSTRQAALDYPASRIIVCFYAGICNLTTLNTKPGHSQVQFTPRSWL
jgi:hypothetical protein